MFCINSSKYNSTGSIKPSAPVPSKENCQRKRSSMEEEINILHQRCARVRANFCNKTQLADKWSLQSYSIDTYPWVFLTRRASYLGQATCGNVSIYLWLQRINWTRSVFGAWFQAVCIWQLNNARTRSPFEIKYQLAGTEKTRVLFLFKLNGIWSWWQLSFRFLNQMDFHLVQKIERKTVTTIISHSMWKEMRI